MISTRSKICFEISMFSPRNFTTKDWIEVLVGLGLTFSNKYFNTHYKYFEVKL